MLDGFLLLDALAPLLATPFGLPRLLVVGSLKSGSAAAAAVCAGLNFLCLFPVKKIIDLPSTF